MKWDTLVANTIYVCPNSECAFQFKLTAEVLKWIREFRSESMKCYKCGYSHPLRRWRKKAELLTLDGFTSHSGEIHPSEEPCFVESHPIQHDITPPPAATVQKNSSEMKE